MSKMKDHYHDQIMLEQKLAEIKEQFGIYIQTEDNYTCNSPRFIKHLNARDALGELLGFPKHIDGSGAYNFSD